MLSLFEQGQGDIALSNVRSHLLDHVETEFCGISLGESLSAENPPYPWQWCYLSAAAYYVGTTSTSLRLTIVVAVVRLSKIWRRARCQCTLFYEHMENDNRYRQF